MGGSEKQENSYQSRRCHRSKPPDDTMKESSMNVKQKTHWVVVAGYAGSGKTECSRLIAQHTGWGLIDKDDYSMLTDTMLIHEGSHAGDRESDIYLNKVRPMEYQLLDKAVDIALDRGDSIITVAPYIFTFSDPYYWENQRQLAHNKGGVLHIIWVQSDVGTMRDRIIQRGSHRDTHKLGHWDDYAHGVQENLGVDQADFIVENHHGAPQLDQQVENILKSILE